MRKLIFLITLIAIFTSCSNESNNNVVQEEVATEVTNEVETPIEVNEEILSEETGEEFIEDIDKKEEISVKIDGVIFPSEENFIERRARWILKNTDKSYTVNKHYFDQLIKREENLGNMEFTKIILKNIIDTTDSFLMLERHFNGIRNIYLNELIEKRVKEIVLEYNSFRALRPLVERNFAYFSNTEFLGPKNPEFQLILYENIREHLIFKNKIEEDELFYLGDKNYGEVKVQMLKDMDLPISFIASWARFTHSKYNSQPYFEELAQIISQELVLRFKLKLDCEIISKINSSTDHPRILMSLPTKTGYLNKEYLLKRGIEGDKKVVADIINIGAGSKILSKEELLGLARMANDPKCWSELINSNVYSIKELIKIASDSEKTNIQRAILLSRDLSMEEIYLLKTKMDGEVPPEMLEQLKKHLKRFSRSELLVIGNKFQNEKVWVLIREVNKERI